MKEEVMQHAKVAGMCTCVGLDICLWEELSRNMHYSKANEFCCLLLDYC